MSFVDFMIIGAMKSGTTTLANILSQHPDICFSSEKEPHFFSKTEDWKPQLDDYKSLYRPTGNQLCGEASTTYTCYPEFNKSTCQSLHEFNPRLKLIYIMRHPIDRMVSHYMHNYLRGYTDGSFEDDVVRYPTYLNRTRYFVQLKPYLEYFGEEQLCLLTFEEFISDKQAVLRRVADFLEIDFEKLSDFENVHNNKSVGGSKKNIKIDKIRKNKWAKALGPFIPDTLKTSLHDVLHQLTARKLAHKPDVSVELSKTLWDLVMLDVLEVEKLMQRELVEWNIPRRSLAHLAMIDSKA